MIKTSNTQTSSVDYSMLLNHALTGRKYYNLSLFKNLDIVGDESKNNVYVKIDTLHEDEFNEYYTRNKGKQSKTRSKYDFFMYKFPLELDEFVDKYNEFIDNNKQENKNAVYATTLKILYPKSLRTDKQKEKFIFHLMDLLANFQESKTKKKGKLLYTVENIRVKDEKVLFALITVIDRSYLGKTEYAVYLQNKYIDTRTGKFAKKSCPKEFKQIKCKKGAYRLDRNKKLIKCERSFSTRHRTFYYNKDGWNEFISKLKNTIINALKKIHTGSFTRGKLLKRVQNLDRYPKFVRRRIAILNHAKETVQYTINYLLMYEYEVCKNKHIKYWRDDKVAFSEAYRQLEKIFERYKKMINKGYFRDEYGELRKIKYHKQRVDEVERNVHKLIKLFFKDVQNVQLSA